MRYRQWMLELATVERKKLLGEIELDESYFGGKRKGKRGRGAAGKVTVFGLLERNGRVCTVVVENVKKETLMAKIEAKSVKGSVYYTDQLQSYLSVKSYGKHYPINHSKEFAQGQHHINGIEGFWAFAKECYLHCHGVDAVNFPLYLQEYEYRYNHRHDDVLGTLYNYGLQPMLQSIIVNKLNNNA
jgi:transposase